MTPPPEVPAPTTETSGRSGPASGDAPEGPLLPSSLVRAVALGRTEPVRAWTPLGTLDAGAFADVDAAGALQLRGATWSLDWWVGAEDRWHHPSREAAVRQHGIEDSPLVETSMRVPGGDVVHRATGVRARAESGWDDSAVLVEVQNDSAVPVALALALRPFTLDGEGRLPGVRVDGPVVRVDGRVVAVLSRPAARAAHGEPGSVAASLAAGSDVDGARLHLDAGAEGLEVALVVPLPHTATVRVLLPRPVRPARRLLRRAPAPVEPDERWEAPEVSAVASGWEAMTRAAARVELPEPVLEPILRATVRSLVLGAGDGFLGEDLAGTPDAATRAAAVCELLARTGTTEALEPLARALVAAQRLDGTVRLADRSDAGGALLHAAAPLLERGAPGWVEDLLGPVAKVVDRLGRDRAAGAGSPGMSGSVGDALGRIAPALRSIDQPEVAGEAERLAANWSGWEAAAGDGVLAATQSLRADLREGRADAVAELVELARLGGPGSLGDRVDAGGVPTGRRGFDPSVVAERANAVLDLVLVETPDGLAVLPGWPREWWGQSIEAHGVRTRWGTASFGLRWHGERPALLWELEPAEGVRAPGDGPAWRAPALDPSWRAQGWTGEALLAPVEVPPTLVAIRGAAAPSTTAPAQEPVVQPEPPAPEGGTFS